LDQLKGASQSSEKPAFDSGGKMLVCIKTTRMLSVSAPYYHQQVLEVAGFSNGGRAMECGRGVGNFVLASTSSWNSSPANYEIVCN
jgi:hypothetical protein